MTTCTPLGLVYPDGSDRPCDADDVSCLFANGVESQLNSLDAIVQRTATSVPMVWIRAQTPLVVDAAVLAAAVPVFDTVVVDTDNMADLTAEASSFTVNTTGIYLIGQYARGTTAQPSANQLQTIVQALVSAPFGILTTTITLAMATFTTVTGSIVAMNQFQILPLTAGQTHTMTVDTSGTAGDSTTFNDLSLWACWVGDMS